MLSEQTATLAVRTLVQTILDPLGRRSLPIEVDVHGEASFRAVVRVGVTFRRDARGDTRELALAKLLLKVERELADRVLAGQRALEANRGVVREAEYVVDAADAVREAAG